MATQDETPGTTVRRLLRGHGKAALATLDRDLGEPYVSLVQFACDHDGSPLLLISDLADHTKNLNRDGRASLLLDGTGGWKSPLAGPRASLQGTVTLCDDARLRERYVARHPDAAMYAGFADFHLYRMELTRAHLVAGFGRIHWIPATEFVAPAAMAGPVAAAEAEIVQHMNEDHGDAVQLYAQLLEAGDGPWTLTGVDPDGADLRAGDRYARLPFDKQAGDAEAVRVELVRLVKRARRGPAEG